MLDRSGNFIRVGEPGKRDTLIHIGQMNFSIPDQRLDYFSFDITGQDRIDPNPSWGPFTSERPRKSDNCSLARRIGGAPWYCYFSGERSNIYDCALPTRNHSTPNLPCHKERTIKISGEYLLKVFWRDIKRRLARRVDYAGIIDQHINRAKFFFNAFNGLLNLDLPAHITADGKMLPGQITYNSLCMPFVSIEHCHPRPSSSKAATGGPAYSRSTSCYENAKRHHLISNTW